MEELIGQVEQNILLSVKYEEPKNVQDAQSVILSRIVLRTIYATYNFITKPTITFKIFYSI